MKLAAENITKTYMRSLGGANCFDVLSNVDLSIEGGSVSVLMGRSGSGKTTLLTIMCGLLTPSLGKVLLDGEDIYKLGDKKLSSLRNRRFAVIPQGSSAISSLSVEENILLPIGISGIKPDLEYAQALMEKLEIAGIADAPPAKLSGGELRRMAIARALAGKPDFIFADEPTADLDDISSRKALELLREAALGGTAVLIVSHEAEATNYADALYRLSGGRLTKE